MRTLVWVMLGWLGVTFWSAVGARVVVGHVLPDAAIVTLIFLALKREPIPLALAAVALGYLVGRQAVAPMGLYEGAFLVCALGAYMASGHLAGGGPLFFAGAAGVAAVAAQLVAFVLSSLVIGQAGFSSWATAAQLPGAVATALLALVSYPWMIRLERRLSPERREGLAWH